MGGYGLDRAGLEYGQMEGICDCVMNFGVP